MRPFGKKEHIMERLLYMVQEQFEADLKALQDFSQVEGRPMFQRELSDDERLMRWLNPEIRAQIEAEIAKTEGLDAVLKYREDMNKLSLKMHRRLGLVEE